MAGFKPINAAQGYTLESAHHQYDEHSPQFLRTDEMPRSAHSDGQSPSKSILNSSGKRRPSSRLASNKRRKCNGCKPSALGNSCENMDDTDSDTLSPNNGLCKSTGCEASTTSLTSLASEDDFSDLRTFLTNSQESSPVDKSAYVENPVILAPPESEIYTRSNSVSHDLTDVPTEDGSNSLHRQLHRIVDHAIDFSMTCRDERSPTISSGLLTSYGQSNNRFSAQSWLPSLKCLSPVALPTNLPHYRFVPLPPDVYPGAKPESTVENSTQSSDGTIIVHEEVSGSQQGSCIALDPKGSRVEKSLLNIKFRPITKSRSRALPTKEIPPLYVPILPSALAWCLVEDADPDSDLDNDSFVTDQSALRTAKHLTGLRVLKRDVTRSEKQEKAKGRIVQQSIDDELLQEYFLAVTKRTSTKKVSFDDSAARIVLADWKGISVDE